MKKIIVISAVVFLTLIGIGLLVNLGPKDQKTLTVEMKNNANEVVGTIALTETKAGVLMYLEVEGLTPEGEHAFHIHETADCTPIESFTNAGGHYNLFDKAHGMKHPEGQHVGDMPNLSPDKDGKIATSVLNVNVTLDNKVSDLGRAPLFDEDGSSLMIHAGADDHMSQPSGAAGDRIACGEIRASLD